jgi:ANTAR domain/GAF domain
MTRRQRPRQGSPKQLAEVFAQVDAELLDAASADDALGRLTALAVRMVPGADHAAITRRSGDQLATVAATSEVALQVDALQFELGQGPCLDAVFDQAIYRTGNLATDRRWKRFGPRVADSIGVVSMLSSRLFLEDDAGSVAALNLYAYTVDAFDESAEWTATVLTTHAALALSGARELGREKRLKTALESNHTIGVAIGILMGRHGITGDQAFDVLALASQHLQRKLADVAGEIIDPTTIDDDRTASVGSRSAGTALLRRCSQ